MLRTSTTSLGAAVAAALLAAAPAFAQPVAPLSSDGRAAYEAAFAALEADPADTERMNAFAAAAMRVGAYDAALGVFERFAVNYPTDPYVRLHLGALYVRLQDYETALYNLDLALGDPRLDAASREAALDYRARAAARLGGLTIDGYAESGVMIDSEEARAGSAAGLAIVPGLIAEDRDPIARSYAEIGLSAAQRLDRPTADRILADLRIVGAKEIGADATDALGGTFVLGSEFAVAPTTIDQLFFGPFVELGGFALRRHASFAYAGAGAALRYESSSDVTWTLRAGYRRYGGDDLVDEAHEVSGALRRAARLHEDLALNLDLAASWREGEAGFSDRTEIGAGATVIYRYEPLVGAGDPWRVSVTADGLWTARNVGGLDRLSPDELAALLGLPIGVVVGPPPVAGDGASISAGLLLRNVTPITETTELFLEGRARRQWSDDFELELDSYGATVGATLRF